MATGRGLLGARVQAGRADGRAGRRARRLPKSSQARSNNFPKTAQQTLQLAVFWDRSVSVKIVLSVIG